MKRIATVAGFALIPGLLTPVAFAAHTDPLGRPEVNLHPDKVSPFTAKANQKTAATVSKSTAEHRDSVARAEKDRTQGVSWPAAGHAILTLPTFGQAKAAPGALPLTLDQPRQAKGSKHAKPVGSVKVEVLDQTRTAALGEVPPLGWTA
ncbi:hypothetical protein [Streptomyces sp. NPDC019224]|uniref:hypothetical protein n=1 Tax=Streptomyces sp. NPDC019224 TaxID=3154484 RepID=UPI00340057E1